MHKTPVKQEIPPAFSSVIGMGGLLDFFSIKRSHRVGTLAVGTLILAGSLASVLYGVLTAMTYMRKYGPALIVRYFPVPAAIGAILFLVGVAFLLLAYHNWKKALAVYESGLVYNDRKGLQVWKWIEIVEFYVSIIKHYTYGVHTGTTSLYTLVDASGSRLVLDNRFERIQELGGLIQQKVLPHQLERLEKAYESGKSLTFGPVQLSKAGGLQIKNKQFRWDEIERITVGQGYMKIAKLSGGIFSGGSMQIARIPNLEAMLAIVDKVVQVQVK